MIATVALALGLLAQEPPPAPEPPAQDPRVVTLGKSRLTFYGFLRLDALFDTDRPNSTQIAQWILSEDLPGTDGAAAGQSDFTMHPRLTRFGMNLEGPRIDELADARLTGKLEIDFYNLTAGNLTSNSREFLRLRHAWLKLDWETFSFLAGQREDVIGPLVPTPNADMVMWNASNLGDRRPQVRPEFRHSGFTATGMIGVTGAQDAQNLDGTPAGSSNVFFDGEASGLPTLQGRLGYEFEGWVEMKRLNIGVWGHWARERLDTPLANGKDDFDSSAVGVDLTLWLHDQAWIKAEAWVGRNVDDLRGAIGQGVNTSATSSAFGDEIDAKGGWVELGIQITPWWMPVIGGYLDDPDRDDLPTTAATANGFGRDRNVILAVCNRFRFGPLEIGADWLHWRTEYAEPTVGDGVDDRFNVFFAYHF